MNEIGTYYKIIFSLFHVTSNKKMGGILFNTIHNEKFTIFLTNVQY